MPNKLTTQDQTTEFLLYTAPNGDVKVEVLLNNETIWLTQDRMAQLFGVQRPAITKHLKKIFESGELQEEVVSSILELTTEHGAISGKTQTNKVKYYNLDAVISVGYRVNSTQATQFRIWATARIKEYIIKGFAMDDERLIYSFPRGRVETSSSKLEANAVIRQFRITVTDGKNKEAA